jgi:2-amino-4-hydroxy-6-hydroxymethyldihydropteridine diphosphokinase
MNYAYILLGTNLGHKITNLNTAMDEIDNKCGKIITQSDIYETAPWGKTEQPSFLNMVVKIETNCNAEVLLERLLSIEHKMGRIRNTKWGERILDLDILYFNNEITVKKQLKIPHPELHNRKFTLIPLCDIAADYKHPIFNISNRQLLERCQDKCEVTRLIIS